MNKARSKIKTNLFTENTVTVNNEQSENTSEENNSQNNQKSSSVFARVKLGSFPKMPGQIPKLPEVKKTEFNQQNIVENVYYHSDNALNILVDIERIITNWQEELQQIIHKITVIYEEGPMIDGWLESDTGETEIGEQKMRLAQDKKAKKKAKGQYRLCILDEKGTIWFYPCPPEEVKSVSMAIARYQQMTQLLQRKTDLQIRINQITQTLAVIHSHING